VENLVSVTDEFRKKTISAYVSKTLTTLLLLPVAAKELMNL